MEDINRIISYWFEVEDPVQKWFFGGAVVDAEIKEQFGTLVEKARASELMSWTEQPKGTLALLVLLDQFPRNIFRGSASSFSSDAMAFDIATKALTKGYHREVSLIQEPFFFLPLVHNETLISQLAGVAFYESLLSRCAKDSKEEKFTKLGVKAAEGHRDIIAKFGRFPARNVALSRQSTVEELKFLEEHPTGY